MKKLLALILALCMVFVLCACGSKAETVPADDPGAVEKKSSVTYSVSMDNTSFDPIQSLSMGCLYNLQVFECLVREETDGTLSPGLAESWEIAPDKLSVTFKIREGVKFHNGDVMTAEDVAFSLNRAIDGSLLDFTVYLDKAEVVDETHVRLDLKSVYSDILSSLSVVNMAIVSKSAVEAAGEGFGTAPIGTGPYMLDNWTTGSSIVLKAFPEYWRGEANIKEITFLVQPDPSTGAIALENGEVDGLGAVLPADVEHLRGVDGITVYDKSSVSTTTIYLNTAGDSPVSDVRVRQAIALCINREDYCAAVMNGFGEPAATIVSPSMAYHNPGIVAPEVDIEKAKELLAEAGYADGLTIKYATVAEAPDLVKIGNILQGQLAPAGITLEVDVKEYSAWFNDVQTNHDFDITCAATTTNASTTGSVLANILAEGAVNNLGLYSNAEVTELLAKANESFEDEAKQECYDRINEIVLEEYPIIPLYSGFVMIAANSNIQGVVCPAVNSMHFYDWSWQA